MPKEICNDTGLGEYFLYKYLAARMTELTEFQA